MYAGGLCVPCLEHAACSLDTLLAIEAREQ
jgi:hypothetical protein